MVIIKTSMNRNDFWVSDPTCLNFLKIWPNRNATTEEIMNIVTVLVVYMSFISSIIVKSFMPLYTGILAIGIIAVVYYLAYSPKEQYKSLKYFNSFKPNQTYVNSAELRTPTKNNPFMNLLPVDYDIPQKFKDYDRYKTVDTPTPSSEIIRNEVDDDFIGGLFQGPNGKLWQRQNSQREFVSQPIGSVPNDQGEFANWLYGNVEGTCKAGSIWQRYGVEYTSDSLLCNGFNAAEPTNFNRKSMNGN